MSYWRTTIISMLAAVACTPVVLNTPVSGSPPAVARLVGEWRGDYDSIDSGRRGSIAFRLAAGTDTAQGEVVMQSRMDGNPTAPNAAPIPWDDLRASQQTLSIRFVFVSGTEVHGVLDPYPDPVCGCTLTTTFRGTITADVIEGTFHSEGNGVGHIPQDGRWRVKRAAP